MASKSADFTVDDGDHFGGYFVTTTTAATVIATLPAAGISNKGRIVPFVKVDSTTGNVKVTVSGGGLIRGLWTDLYLINQGDSLTAISDGVLWQTEGTIQPVAGEPSLGTLHILASPTAYNLISGAAVSNTWTDLTCSGAPTGTKAALLSVVCDFTANAAALSYGFCHLRPNGSSWGIGVCVACGFLINPAISGTKYESGAQARVPVDSSKIFEYYFENSATSARNLYITLLGYWI